MCSDKFSLGSNYRFCFGWLSECFCSLCCFDLRLCFSRIEKHSSAHAVLATLAHQDLVVDATLTTFPKLFIVGEFGIRYWFVSKIGVDLHYGQPGCESKYFGVGIFY